MNSPRGTSHAGIALQCTGTTKLAVSARNLGLVESFYSKIEPITLMRVEVLIEKPGKVPPGKTEFPFEFTLKPLSGKALHETYHGVYANTSYVIVAECVRKGLMSSNLSMSVEIVVEVPTGAGEFDAEPADFNITPSALDNVKQQKAIDAFPPFSISGQLHRTNCSITAPLTGEIVVDESEAVISSIELQLVRVETVTHQDKEAREATEIQNIQIAEGDVARKLIIPIYSVFPRLFTCPTMLTKTFKVEFECNLIIIFADGYMITENFPLLLYR